MQCLRSAVRVPTCLQMVLMLRRERWSAIAYLPPLVFSPTPMDDFPSLIPQTRRHKQVCTKVLKFTAPEQSADEEMLEELLALSMLVKEPQRRRCLRNKKYFPFPASNRKSVLFSINKGNNKGVFFANTGGNPCKHTLKKNKNPFKKH